MNKPIGWGKCSIIVKDLDAAAGKWVKLPAPKESTTTLSTTKGDKKEATTEGGEVEDVKYGKSKYAIAYSYRRNTDRKKMIADTDGGLLTYTHDAITASDGKTVKWCTIPTDLNTLAEGATIEEEPVFTDVDAAE